MFKPFYSQLIINGLCFFGVNFPIVQKAQSVPHFIRKITSLFAQFIVKFQITARRTWTQNAKTHAVCPKFFNQTQGIGRIAQRFWHFTPLFIPNHARKINAFERTFLLPLITRHRHTCDPQKDNIPTRYQNTCWIIIIKLLRIFKAIENRNGPQPRACPSIQYIFVLF